MKRTGPPPTIPTVRTRDHLHTKFAWPVSASPIGLPSQRSTAAPRVRAARHAPRDRAKTFRSAHRRVKRSRSGEALPRDQHRADARRQGYAGSCAAHSHKRDRSLGADHQGGRRIRGLARSSASHRTRTSTHSIVEHVAWHP
jgi:hypothetical protein